MDKNNSQMLGFWAGCIAAFTYGLNPLFALPLYQEGFSSSTVLAVRFTLASVIFALILLLRKTSLRLCSKEVLWVVPAGILFATSAHSLYSSYREMDAGIASTLLFVYPFMTAFIMWFFFHEKVSFITLTSMILAMAGIVLLYKQSDGSVLSTKGFILVMLSALSYAVYMVWLNKTRLQTMPVQKLTFYVIITAAVYFLLLSVFQGAPVGKLTWKTFGLSFGIALLPTVISLVFTSVSVQKIGATVTSILGALECLTAVVVGVTVFHEKMTFRIAVGIFLILFAVTMVTLEKGRRSNTQNKTSSVKK